MLNLKEKKYNKNNWEKDEYGNYICPQGHKTRYISESENTKGEYMRINFSLSTIRCLECPVKGTVLKLRIIDRTRVKEPLPFSNLDMVKNDLEEEE